MTLPVYLYACGSRATDARCADCPGRVLLFDSFGAVVVDASVICACECHGEKKTK